LQVAMRYYCCVVGHCIYEAAYLRMIFLHGPVAGIAAPFISPSADVMRSSRLLGITLVSPLTRASASAEGQTQSLTIRRGRGQSSQQIFTSLQDS
jgi:hypothetical protein